MLVFLQIRVNKVLSVVGMDHFLKVYHAQCPFVKKTIEGLGEKLLVHDLCQLCVQEDFVPHFVVDCRLAKYKSKQN